MIVDPSETPHYLAIDPGETTGWASFNAKGNLLGLGQVSQKELKRFLFDNIPPELKGVIVEDYRNHAWNRQKNWSRNQTSKNIGMIEMACELSKVPIHLQSNTVKAIGYKWGGIEPPTNHSISHQYDAYAHGVYYLQLNGIRPIGKALLEND